MLKFHRFADGTMMTWGELQIFTYCYNNCVGIRNHFYFDKSENKNKKNNNNNENKKK